MARQYQSGESMIIPSPSRDVFYAHTLPGRPPAEWEPFSDHQKRVAELAETFAQTFGAGPWGRVIGTCHDLGKLSEEFQSYLYATGQTDESDDNHSGEQVRVDHSTFGARLVAAQYPPLIGQLLAYCIAGHHGGLPNEFSADSASQRGTLTYRLNPDSYKIPSVSCTSVEFPALAAPIKCSNRHDLAFQIAFFTRMLFSCLIDADRTATEEFCAPELAAVRSRLGDQRAALQAIQAKIVKTLKAKMSSAAPTLINKHRAKVLANCHGAASLAPGFFSLNVPTGGGKTLASLAFALDHALAHNLRRVVVAIPFTSIIEQTADVYRNALEELSEHSLVEHHSNLRPRNGTVSNQLGSENWDAPLIVTTNVQLFESLFASKTTPCRKLHNLAKSVIVLDECQTIPVNLLRPALAALKELVQNYGCSIVLCTATLPALEFQPDFPIGLQDVRPIIPDARPLFDVLRRVDVKKLEEISEQDLTGRIAAETSALCIVNTRKAAASLYDSLSGSTNPAESFHLSTWMCGAHRREILRIVRDRLDKHLPCKVISTQLIEAGVDLDFPAVYRAEAGFDSVAQAAGRCNREGLLAMGHVYLFRTGSAPPAGQLRSGADAARELMGIYPDPLSPEAIQAYFRLYYWNQKDIWDQREVMKTMACANGRALIEFRDAAKAFQVIEDDGVPILIPYDETARGLSEDLITRRLPYVPHRAMQQYLVTVTQRDGQQLQERGAIVAHECGVRLLVNHSIYSYTKGLDPGSTRLDESLWSV